MSKRVYRLKGIDMNADYLKNNPVFWSRLGFCYDPPLPNDKGEPLVFTENFDKYLKTHREFYEAGVKIHTSILHSGWVGVDKYDYTLTDRVLDAVFSVGDDVLYIPRIKLNVPVDWCYENPEDVFVYYGGPTTAEEIRSLVGTEKHDYLGYDSPNGYYRAGDYKDPRPNVNGLIARQSFSSKKWLRDATVALEKLLDRLESSPYADRIIGYHIAYGTSGETIMWGRISRRFGDYGITNRREFYNYGLKKYGTPEALSRAWCQRDVTPDTLILPTPEERNGIPSSDIELFRFSDKDRISIDYDMFVSDSNADALIHFAKAVKARVDKPVGAFYGYLLYVSNAAYAGHLALDKLLSSPFIDFFAAPKAYARCGAGEPGGEICPAQSINLRKIYLEELDNRTYLAVENEDDIKQGMVPADSHDSITVMWRELCKNLSHGSGFWWMDLGGGWFASEPLMNTVKQMIKVASSIRAVKGESIADMLIVLDERSSALIRESGNLHEKYLREFIYNTAASGVVFDVYRASDLSQIDLSKYKLVVFAYNIYMDKKTLKVAEELSANITVKKSFGCGAWNDISFEYEAKNEAETNFNDRVVPKGDIPPYMSSQQIRDMARAAGCHIYSDAEGVTVYGDSRFIGIFNSDVTDGTVDMLERGNYFDVINSERFIDVKSVPLPYDKRGVRLLVRDYIL